ncbi:MAG: ABC transporter permease [Phycisphaerales bacterium]|nr:MAG: ABC transporter permease [Phycisphaerales bacterium]
MLSYIVRRLLLMIPTLLGITFLVFMLIALSPGGIGADLAFGGDADATNRAIQEAYLEDRYGLGDPAVMQYVRWLRRISPIKFGTRDQISGAGEIISAPRTIEPPPLWEWYADELPDPDAVEFEGFADDVDSDARRQAYREAENRYVRRRAEFVAARIGLRDALAEYAREIGREDVVAGDGTVDFNALQRFGKDPSTESWDKVQAEGEKVLEAFEAARSSQLELGAIFAERPFPEAGYGIIPGVLSVAAPDLGMSFSRSRPVSALIADALPVTLMINLIAFPIIYMIAIPSGMIAALRRRSFIDVAIGVVLVGLWAIPIVWAGVLAVGFVANEEFLGWFPVSGIGHRDAETFTFLPTFVDGAFQRGVLLDTLWHLTLPILCLVYGAFAVLSKQTRAAMLDNLNADYVRTAKAKGVASKDVIFKHVFRNSLLPLITMFVMIFPAMLSGSVVIEQIFSIPGMGRLVIEAINLRDREVILAVTLIIAAVNIFALLLADILYAMADPRISYS